MSDPFDLIDAENARKFLNSFDVTTRRRGEDYFRRGLVKEISPVTSSKPGTHYLAAVQGTNLYSVDITFRPKSGWDTHCSCPVRYDCKHGYAAMKALLAEYSIAEVRDLSSNAIDVSTRQAAQTAVVKAAEPSERPILPVATLAANALGRPLERAEAAFCRRLTEVYQRCSLGRKISRWDFDDLGISLGGYGWEPLSIWPHFPETEYDFWLYIANAAEENGVPYPLFLKPVSDVAEIRKRLTLWRREQAIKRWKDKLVQAAEKGGGTASRGQYDMRLVMDRETAVLEWKRPGRNDFEPVKPILFRQFVDDFRHGRVGLDPAIEVMCQLAASRLLYNSSLELRYDEPEALAMVGQLLRMKTLESRIVSFKGQLLAREEKPVHWELTEAKDEKEDYFFHLALADGSPLTGFLCAIAGHPTLYVSETAIYPGPSFNDDVLNPASENSVPAPALETISGIQFLNAFGIALPSRIRERVRNVSMSVSIRCHIEPIHPESPTEDCVFEVRAESDDGNWHEKWDGRSWEHVNTTKFAQKPAAEDKTLPLYDRSVLQGIPALLEPLGLKIAAVDRSLRLRITRKFPDLFVSWLKTIPSNIHLELEGDLASFKKAIVSGHVHLDVKETTIDWFDLSVVVDVSDTTLTPAEIKLLLNAKGSYVRLKNKGWRKLEFDLTEEEDEHLANLGLNPHELTSEPQHLHALQLADNAARRFLPEEQVARIQRRAEEIKARVMPDLPAGVKAGLRPYQLDGYHFLAYLSTNRFGGILADDMGLGKTLQTLAWLLWLRESFPKKNAIPPALVVCPKSVTDNWKSEAMRFTPELRVRIWSAAELEDLPRHLKEADLHVINYSQLRLDKEMLVAVDWLAVILDEGQYIKNPNSQTAQAARRLRSEHRLVLSGTPIENRLTDLWSLMAFAMPGILSTRAQFGRLFDSKTDPLARRRLAARVRPFLLRRTKSQVATDLPERVEEDLLCELEGEQKLLYRAELKRAQQMLLKVKMENSLEKHQFNFLTSLLRLRQICCHPALVHAQTKASSAKMDALIDHLEPLMDDGEKVLVFSQFVELLGILKPAMAKHGWKTFYLAGDTENRGEVVKKFQEFDGPAVFLISLKAGGFGLNLTAANYVVLFDPWWNPAVENQAIDRTHRIGQLNTVIAYRLLIKDSVEEKIRTLQKTKSALAHDVLGEEKFSQSLTMDDLQFLFGE